jgi:hypothetical protein
MNPHITAFRIMKTTYLTCEAILDKHFYVRRTLLTESYTQLQPKKINIYHFKANRTIADAVCITTLCRLSLSNVVTYFI